MSNNTFSENDQGVNKMTHERFKYGDIEYEIQSSEPEYVRSRMDSVIKSLLTNNVSLPSENQLVLVTTTEETVPSSDNNDTVERKDNVEHETLTTLYRRKAPKNQMEQLLVVVFHYSHNEGIEYMTYESLNNAYIDHLLKLGVKPPTNPREVVSKAVKERYLYKHRLENGKFGLTEQGKDFVENLKS